MSREGKKWKQDFTAASSYSVRHNHFLSVRLNIKIYKCKNKYKYRISGSLDSRLVDCFGHLVCFEMSFLGHKNGQCSKYCIFSRYLPLTFLNVSEISLAQNRPGQMHRVWMYLFKQKELWLHVLPAAGESASPHLQAVQLSCNLAEAVRALMKWCPQRGGGCDAG